VVKVVDFKSLAPIRCGFKSRQGLWILSCEEAIQLAYGTSVVLLRCPFVPEMCTEGHLMYSSNSKNGTSRFDLYCVAGRKTQTQRKQTNTTWREFILFTQSRLKEHGGLRLRFGAPLTGLNSPAVIIMLLTVPRRRPSVFLRCMSMLFHTVLVTLLLVSLVVFLLR
jgi:hypothetical protein